MLSPGTALAGTPEQSIGLSANEARMTLKQLLESMADLEARIAVIYERFATEFRGVADVSDLWDSMSREEVQHAELLTRTAATASDAAATAHMLGEITKLQQVLIAYEREQRRIVTLQGALRLTADLEDAEATYLHGALSADPSVAALATDPALQHRLHRVLEHAIDLFGTPALKERLAQHSSD